MATSVHDLVRLLKSSADPPSASGRPKIEIASLAWSDTSFRAANKGEVIGEWILTAFAQAKKTRREKDAISTVDPIADSRYWTLLCAVLATPPHTAARSIKTWLLPLLNRFQLDTIVIELLVLRSSEVLGPARLALSVLWPLGEKKIGVDALSECLGAVLDACMEWERINDDLDWVCSSVVAAYRNALANASNKKKSYNSFLNTHLSSWLRAIRTGPSLIDPSSTKQLQDNIYVAGTDTLFSPDALKQPLDILFDALPSFITSLLPVLPKLYVSFLSATYRRRSALFVSATSVVGAREEVRKRGMEFMGRCWVLVRDSVGLQEDFEAEKWKAAVGILRIVEKERLFVAHPVHAEGERGGELALRETRDKAVEMLETLCACSEERQTKQVALSIQLLDVLVQIEYDFVGSVLERVISALINIPPPLFRLVTMVSSEFLTHVLEYHTKTRTVHTYALALLGAIAASSSSTFLAPSSRSLASIFPLAYHLPALASAVHTSLTPTQTTPLATAVLQAVENAWEVFKDANEEESRASKRRKATEDVTESCPEARSVPGQARIFSFTGRVAGTILSNLPVNDYIGVEEHSIEQLWSNTGRLGWTIIWDCLGEKRRDTKSKESKKRKHVVETSPPSAVYPHIVTSAALRFLYDVRARVSSLLGDCDRLGETHVGTLLQVARDETSDPELVLEIIRTLIWHVWYIHTSERQTRPEARPIFIVILDILTARPLSESKWSGISATLTRDNLGLAVLFVLTRRWIDVFDVLASTDVLERLVSMLLVVSFDSLDEDTRNSLDDDLQRDDIVITLRGTLHSLLRNAQFWELHNFRGVFLTSVLALTAPLAPYCFPIASELPSPMAYADLTLACNAYSLLHYVPSEYYTRPARSELVKRAMAADVQICTQLEKGQQNGVEVGKPCAIESDDRVPTDEFKTWTRRLTFVRTFAHRMGQFLGTPSHATSLTYVNHLLSVPSCAPFPSKVLTSVTLDLIQLHILGFLRSQGLEAAAAISSVISTLVATRPFSQPGSQDTWTQFLIKLSVLKLIERVTSDFDPASLLDQVKLALTTLVEALESALSPDAERSVGNDVRVVDQFSSSERINAWSRMLSLRRWLGMHSQVTTVSLGLKLATSTIRDENATRVDYESRSSILGLLFEELWCMPDSMRRVHLDVLVCFYAVNDGDQGSDIERIVDIHVTQASKKMFVEDFSHLLDVLEEGIRGSGLRADRRGRLIHLAQVMLHDAPQGTLKVIQHFATRCFNVFADREEIYGGPSHLKLHCLEFITRHCSDRPGAIRSVDLGSIWSFLTKTLSGSSEHEATTELRIFHQIVAIIGALIRLRRDLVIHTLPHLGLVLRQLMMLTRKIRPQLGAKQSKIVTDTFPSWLSASEPLCTDEARALARLLASLTTKMVPRTHIYASTELQKAESLAKPFAKHASYVLVAYVDAFNDPLCVINAEMRRGLEPGLFALCEMVGEHSRDALMVSTLDSGGKTIMKSLWMEYEKQRYVGKG